MCYYWIRKFDRPASWTYRLRRFASTGFRQAFFFLQSAFQSQLTTPRFGAVLQSVKFSWNQFSLFILYTFYTQNQVQRTVWQFPLQIKTILLSFLYNRTYCHPPTRKIFFRTTVELTFFSFYGIIFSKDWALVTGFFPLLTSACKVRGVLNLLLCNILLS